MARLGALLRLALLELVAASACSPRPASAPVLSPPPRSLPSEGRAASGPPPVPPPRVRIAIASDAAVDNRVACTIHIDAPLSMLAGLRFAPSHEVKLEAVTLRDASGAIPLRVDSVRPAGSDGEAASRPETRVELGRAVVGALDIAYRVTFSAGAGAEDGPSAEPIELRASGEDLLLLPDAAPAAAAFFEPFAFDLSLRTGGSSVGAASSFGLGMDQHGTARFAEFRRAFYLAGDVGTASFHTGDGDDVAGWLGNTAFDPRWVSAETAAVRSAVDAYMGRMATPASPAQTLLITAVKRDDIPVLTVGRTRGLVASVDRRAIWNASARILVTQSLVQRYIGSYVTIGARGDPSGAFVSSGYARAVAREVLFQGGEIDHIERAAELNLLLAATTFSTKPNELATARGALHATALDVALRKASNGQRGLREFLREQLVVGDKGSGELAVAEFDERLRRAAGDPWGSSRRGQLSGERPIALPADLLGKCWRLESKVLVPFDLGFRTTSGEQVVVTAVDEGSHAEAAGLKVGDTVTKLHVEKDFPAVPVTMTILRPGPKPGAPASSIELRFTPAGAGKPGRIFERVAGIPDKRC